MNPPYRTSCLAWAFEQFNHQEVHRLSRRWRFVLRSLVLAGPSRTWFSHLRQHDALKAAPAPSEWLQVPHRPFFDRRLSARQVSQLLVHDLDTSLALFGAQRFEALMRGDEWTMTQVQGRSTCYSLCLRKETRFSKEGTLTLCLVRPDGEVLKRLVFTFAPGTHGHELRIGCVQSTANDTLVALRQGTKELHGLQPRLLLLHALRVFAQHTGCHAIQAVAGNHHIYRSRRYRGAKTLPGYDELWSLAGGTLRGDGNYDLPLDVPAKPLDEYPSHKRAEYRRRQALAEALERQVQQALGR